MCIFYGAQMNISKSYGMTEYYILNHIQKVDKPHGISLHRPWGDLHILFEIPYKYNNFPVFFSTNPGRTFKMVKVY